MVSAPVETELVVSVVTKKPSFSEQYAEIHESRTGPFDKPEILSSLTDSGMHVASALDTRDKHLVGKSFLDLSIECLCPEELLYLHFCDIYQDRIFIFVYIIGVAPLSKAYLVFYSRVHFEQIFTDMDFSPNRMSSYSYSSI